ncbi:DNA polymerase III epsilon subunit-like protein/stress response protein SCP2 [Paenibacillus phyllosphaerae]|uniref:DNA polymerase III epsilon subunit-like protein/stress response protein SCP2 n=1 Tax=Paenibacillus phyllosphaerae TaxID=274593 RepID=A0A7W5AZ62_9BACL|nr:TerD family protein [Paenibacillus phyllosphaerae]MBB3111455.1 DNA polymerase III epsilon subunit-like protein/stress response protein SCP2 [Paenibacillus phyllosphaerae]
MNMEFVAIDFETANSNRSSACSLGLVQVSGGRIVKEQVWLINPMQRFDAVNIGIHGITPAMVAGQPTFREIWPEISPLLRDRHVVAHNASFDMSVLRYCLDEASLPYPTFQYFCTYAVSKRLLPDLPSYRLNAMAELYGIRLKHHDALDDARAAAILLLRIMEQKGSSDLLRLSADEGWKVGRMYPGGYAPFSAPAAKLKRKPARKEPAAVRQPKPAASILPEPSQALQLATGQRVDVTKGLATGKLVIEVTWRTMNPAIELDATAFLLHSDGKCRQDEDCIFYGHPEERNGSLSYSKPEPSQARFVLAYPNLPAQIQKIAFTLSIYEGEVREHFFREVAEITIRVKDPSTGRELMYYRCGDSLTNETALVVAELYSYRGDWKFNPIGKGFFGGLHALANDYGLEVANEQNEAAAARESRYPND